MKASIFIRYFCGSVAVLLLWQLGSVTLGSDILPDPLRALGGFWDALKDPEFIGHIGLSLYRLLTALALAIVVSFPLVVLLGHSKAADWLGAPVTFITLPLPKIVLLPVFFTILGLGLVTHSADCAGYGLSDSGDRARIRSGTQPFL